MTGPLGPLPDFERPPVVEVAFAASVEPLPVSLIELSAFAEKKQSALTPVPCELWYISVIEPGGLWSRPGQLDKTIRLVNGPGEFLPEPEDGQLATQFRIRHDERDVGRLYVNVTSARRPSGTQPVIQLTMTARGAPLRPDRQGMVDFFRLAHEWIVRGFAAVTTDSAQVNLWGRRQ